MIRIDNSWEKLSKAAWEARENSSIIGKTKVGSALLDNNGKIYVGCNVEQTFRSHDIHAEVNVIGNMIVNGGKSFSSIIIVAEREMFTPCGSCMDWIMQFGNSNTIIGFQNKIDGEIQFFKAKELMPYYPN